MNRIYQGRVTSFAISDDGKNFHPYPYGSKETCPLWCHHVIFQDAINYYLVALGALADSKSENRVAKDLRARLADSWEDFRKKSEATSLRESLRRTLPLLSQDSSLDECFAIILEGQESHARTTNPSSLENLLTALLEKNGDGKIRNGGPSEFPKFCCTNTNANFSGEHARKSLARLRLILTLHGKIQGNLADFGALDLATASKRPNRRVSLGEESRKKLIQCVEKLVKESRVDPAFGVDLKKQITEIPQEQILSIPAYEAGGESREKSVGIPVLLLAKQLGFPAWSQDLLKTILIEPKGWETQLEMASRNTSANIDPLEQSRGKRGFVFPAFTALSAWNPCSPGEPVWKDFDIAAFKEALKALNQFNQKTIERANKLRQAEATLAYMLGENDSVPKSADGEAETKSLSRPGRDSRWHLIEKLETELSENLNEGKWQLTRSALRSLRDIAELWNKEKNPTEEDLQQIVKDYQADDKHKRDVGSVQLFLLLCGREYWPLWQTGPDERDDEEEEPSVKNLLSAAVEVHQLEQEIERYKEPIRLTPAEPEFSRRLFMFSDLTDKLAKVRFGESSVNGQNSHFLETAIALCSDAGFKEIRVRIEFSAPRLHRDELLGGAESRWLQPMTAALGLPNHPAKSGFESAVSLMPDVDSQGKLRLLLNFPVQLDTDWIHKAIGRSFHWKNQFNGTKDHFLHLHWPGTARDATRKNAWWENATFIEKGFTVLSNDLGQRSAGAWALLKITAWKPNTTRPVRSIGHDGAREWFAEVLSTGMHRLPGEDVKILNRSEWQTEPFGKSGRNALNDDLQGLDELQEAHELAIKLGISKPESWITEKHSFPEQNDQLIKIANRRLSRLGTYHRWSCFDPERPEVAQRRETIIDNLKAELAVLTDPEALPMQNLLETGDYPRFRDAAGNAFSRLRTELETLLADIANRAVPLRGKIWRWAPRADTTPYGDLIMEGLPGSKPKIRGQRGLSMARLEQLENLRRLFLRFNRSFDRQAGQAAVFGRNDKDRKSGEPCQELLNKIERMKEQRVNQTAHLILAQALGVRLKSHAIPQADREDRDLHGEYEAIPGRQVVDFIVIEDLSRYLSNQGRSPSENSRLMKWAHRAVRDKLKMLAEEPFGIPVVEVIPAYSSRFHAVNGQPGTRLYELSKLDDYRVENVEKNMSRAGEKAISSKFSKEKEQAILFENAYRELRSQFAALATANQSRPTDKKPHTLYFLQPGGPLFLAIRDGNPVQADINAAINLGLRGIAAPSCCEIHRRIRITKEKTGYRIRRDNAREKAAFREKETLHLAGKASAKLEKSKSPNFFYEPDKICNFDRASLASANSEHSFASGVALWNSVNIHTLLRCVELNRARLQKWGIPIPDAPETLRFPADPDDNIPM